MQDVKHVISYNPFSNFIHLTDEEIVQVHTPSSRDLIQGGFSPKPTFLVVHQEGT